MNPFLLVPLVLLVVALVPFVAAAVVLLAELVQMIRDDHAADDPADDLPPQL
jgi:hypothetical protein